MVFTIEIAAQKGSGQDRAAVYERAGELVVVLADGAGGTARGAETADLIVAVRYRSGMQLRRGRLIDHLHLVVADLAASKRFYAAVLGAVGVPIQHEGPEFFSADELFVSSTKDSATHALTGRHHFAFATRDRATVDAFHRAGLAAGGRDNGAPGERAQYHPGYYGAFLLDPDGNNVEAVFHGPATYSADAIVIDA